MSGPAATSDSSPSLEDPLIIGDDDEEFNELIDQIAEIIADNEEPSGKKAKECLETRVSVTTREEENEEVETMETMIVAELAEMIADIEEASCTQAVERSSEITSKEEERVAGSIQTTVTKVVSDVEKTVEVLGTGNETKFVVTPTGQHPFQNLLDNIYNAEPLKCTAFLPKSIYNTSLLEVRTQSGLNVLVEKLSCEKEIAIDLVVSNRTYLPCVVAILLSTKDDDIYVDVLQLKEVEALNKIFIDKNIVKVFYCHKVTNVLKFLQHLKLYPVNIFDIATAHVALHKNFEPLSKQLLQRYGHKMEYYTKGDVLQRPLSCENRMFYILQTHFVLHIYHSIKNSLLDISGDVFMRVLKDSNDFCRIVFPISDNHHESNHFHFVEDIKKIHQYQLLLVEKLEKWRQDTAKEKNVHPTSVMTVATMASMTLDIALKDVEISAYLESQYARTNVSQLKNLLNEAKMEMPLPGGPIKPIYNRRIIGPTRSVKPQYPLKPTVSPPNSVIKEAVAIEAGDVKKLPEPVKPQLKSQPVNPTLTEKSASVGEFQTVKPTLVAKPQLETVEPVKPEKELQPETTPKSQFLTTLMESQCSNSGTTGKTEQIRPLVVVETEMESFKPVQVEEDATLKLVTSGTPMEVELAPPQVTPNPELETRQITTELPESVKPQIDEKAVGRVEVQLAENAQELAKSEIVVPMIPKAQIENKTVNKSQETVKPELSKTKLVSSSEIVKTALPSQVGKNPCVVDNRKRKFKNNKSNRLKKPKILNNRPLMTWEVRPPENQRAPPFVDDRPRNNLPPLIKPDVMILAQRLLPLLNLAQNVQLRPNNSYNRHQPSNNFNIGNNLNQNCQLLNRHQPLFPQGGNYHRQLPHHRNFNWNGNPELQHLQRLGQRRGQMGNWDDDASRRMWFEPPPYLQSNMGGWTNFNNQHCNMRKRF